MKPPASLSDGPQPAVSRPGLALLATLLLALGLRLLAASGELWLDEVWSIRIAKSVDTVAGVVTQIRRDNHLLYTVFLHFLPDSLPPLAYRAPSLLAFVLVLLTVRGLCRNGYIDRAAAVFLVILVSFSHLFVMYDSEARGYAPAVACSFMAFALLRSGLSGAQGFAGISGNGKLALAYNCAVMLAILFQPLAVQFLLAAGVWSCRHWRLVDRLTAKQTGLRLLRWHGSAAGIFAVIYLFHLRHLLSGGGDYHAWHTALGGAVRLVFGLPAGFPDGLAAGAGIALAAGFCAWLYRQPDSKPLAMFMTTLCLLAPAILFSMKKDAYLYPRYFILNAFFLHFCLALLLGKLWRRPGGRAAACACTILFLAGNLNANAGLLRHGRSRYGDLVADILAAPGGTATIKMAGDQDFRHRLMLEHVAPAFAGNGRTLMYFDAGQIPPEGVEWLIFCQQPAGDNLVDLKGRLYRRERTYLSGNNFWYPLYLYRRVKIKNDISHAGTKTLRNDRK